MSPKAKKKTVGVTALQRTRKRNRELDAVLNKRFKLFEQIRTRKKPVSPISESKEPSPIKRTRKSPNFRFKIAKNALEPRVKRMIERTRVPSETFSGTLGLDELFKSPKISRKLSSSSPKAIRFNAAFEEKLKKAAKKGDLMGTTSPTQGKLSTTELYRMLDRYISDEEKKKKKNKSSPKKVNSGAKRTSSLSPERRDKSPTPDPLTQDMLNKQHREGSSRSASPDIQDERNFEVPKTPSPQRSPSPDASKISADLQTYNDPAHFNDLVKEINRFDNRVSKKLLTSRNSKKTMELARLLEIWKARIKLMKLAILAGKHWNPQKAKKSKLVDLLEDKQTQLQFHITTFKKDEMKNPAAFYKNLNIFKVLADRVTTDAEEDYNKWEAKLGPKAKQGVKAFEKSSSEEKKIAAAMISLRRKQEVERVINQMIFDVDKRAEKAVKENIKHNSSKYTKVMVKPKKGSPVAMFIAKPASRKRVKSLPVEFTQKKTIKQKLPKAKPQKRAVNKQLDEEEEMKKDKKVRFFFIDQAVYRVFGDYVTQTRKNEIPAALGFDNGIPIYSKPTFNKWNIKGEYKIDVNATNLPTTHHYILLRGIKVGINKKMTVLKPQNWDPCSRFKTTSGGCTSHLSIENEPRRCVKSRDNKCSTEIRILPDFYGKKTINYNSIDKVWNWKPPKKLEDNWNKVYNDKLNGTFSGGWWGTANQFDLVETIEWIHEDLKQLKISMQENIKKTPDSNSHLHIVVPKVFKPGSSPFQLSNGTWAKLSPEAEDVLKDIPTHFTYMETLELETTKQYGEKIIRPQGHRQDVIRDYPDLRKAIPTGDTIKIEAQVAAQTVIDPKISTLRQRMKRKAANIRNPINVKIITGDDILHLMRKTYQEGFINYNLNVIINSSRISDSARALAFDNDVDLRTLNVIRDIVRIDRIKTSDVEIKVKDANRFKHLPRNKTINQAVSPFTKKIKEQEKKIEKFNQEMIDLTNLTKQIKKVQHGQWELNMKKLRAVKKDMKEFLKTITYEKHKQEMKELYDRFMRSMAIYEGFLDNQEQVLKDRRDQAKVDEDFLLFSGF